MAKKRKKTNRKYQVWIDARNRHHLSHTQVQMARELGLDPGKLGKLNNHTQEPWKVPLKHYIEELYVKRFGKERPDRVISIEEKIRLDQEKKELKREKKRLRALEAESESAQNATSGLESVSERKSAEESDPDTELDPDGTRRHDAERKPAEAD